jgi:hypothetical protein
MESENSPLLSIVIATRNRIPYAISAIQSILEIADPRLELIIQDNSDSRELESFVRDNVADRRMAYRYTPPPFSSIDNFNAALELSSGEYVCMIGDDDGVNPEILEAAAWARENDVDSLAMRSTAQYLWQGTGVRSTLFTKISGATFVIKDFGQGIQQADVEKEMRALIRNGGLYYLDYGLPKLYHGLVRRRCLETVRTMTGAYLGGLSPDIFASLTVACIAQRVAVTDYPLTIPGACGASTSVTEGATKKHSTKLEDAPHFRDRGAYQWSELVPRVYASETIWVDSALAALRAMGRTDLVAELNLPKLAAYCIVANRGVARRTLQDTFKAMRQMHRSPAVGALQFAFYLLAVPTTKFVRRAFNRALMILGVRRHHRIDDVVNMVEVSHALTSYLREHVRSFSDSALQSRMDAPGGLNWARSA